MADIFGDNPPQDMLRSKKGWLKAKATPTKKQLLNLKNENAELKTRLEQLEAAVEQLVSKKKK